MARIELSQLIPSLNATQQLFFTGFYAQFDNRSAANRHIANVEPIMFYGAPAGTEYSTYAVNKLYIITSAFFSANSAGVASVNGVLMYNESNTLVFNLANAIPYYDGSVPATRYYLAGFGMENFYFSRIDVSISAFNRALLIGYRVTLD